MTHLPGNDPEDTLAQGISRSPPLDLQRHQETPPGRTRLRQPAADARKLIHVPAPPRTSRVSTEQHGYSSSTPHLYCDTLQHSKTPDDCDVIRRKRKRKGVHDVSELADHVLEIQFPNGGVQHIRERLGKSYDDWGCVLYRHER